MHDRNRAAPVALAGQAPVAQAELLDSLAQTLRLHPVDGGVDGFLPGRHVETGEVIDPLHLLRLRRDEGGVGHRLRVVERQEGVDHRQIVLAAEVEVALVVRRRAEDRARAVVHQDEVGDPDRHFPRGVERVLHLQSGVEAQLLRLFQRLFGGAALAHRRNGAGQLGVVLLKRLGQRMIRGQPEEGRAQKRVGAGGVDVDGLEAVRRLRQRPGELQPARPADPVGLHQLHLRGPVVQPVDGIQKLARHVGDLEEPLRQFAALDLGAGAPALAVDHLLVRQNGHVDRVPVHHGILAVDQPLGQHVDEQRLLLAVVFGIAGGEHPRPVEAEAQRLHLADHRVDVAVGPVLRVPAGGHGRVLGRHPEGVEAHRVQHVEAVLFLVPRDHVAHRVVADVTDVDAARRIGEHLQHVVLGLVTLAGGLEGQGVFPGLLPLRLDAGGVIARHVFLRGRIGRRVSGGVIRSGRSKVQWPFAGVGAGRSLSLGSSAMHERCGGYAASALEDRRTAA